MEDSCEPDQQRKADPCGWYTEKQSESGSVGVVCLNRKLASLPLPEYHQEVGIWDWTQR